MAMGFGARCSSNLDESRALTTWAFRLVRADSEIEVRNNLEQTAASSEASEYDL